MSDAMPETAQDGASGFAELLQTALRRAASDGVRFSAGSSDLEAAHFAPDTGGEALPAFAVPVEMTVLQLYSCPSLALGDETNLHLA